MKSIESRYFMGEHPPIHPGIYTSIKDLSACSALTLAAGTTGSLIDQTRTRPRPPTRSSPSQPQEENAREALALSQLPGLTSCMTFGLVLLFDATCSARVELGSESLGRRFGKPNMKLGEGAPPHVTIVHFDADLGPAAAAWDLLCSQFPQPRVMSDSISSSNIDSYDYYVPEGGFSLQRVVQSSPELESLHHEALQLVSRMPGQPIGKVGAEYSPHITLGVWPASLSPPIVESVERLDSQAGVALGILGPYGTFPSIIRRIADTE